MTALAATPVRVPKTLLLCEDESVIGAPFYVMEKVAGKVIRDRLPDGLDVAARAAIGAELVDSLVELHGVDPARAGLEGLGKPTGYLERQLRRWGGQLDLTLPFTRPMPLLEEVGSWLARRMPESGPSTVVHGDYKLDNVMFEIDPRPRLVAILDWEMSTIGDPLADLGWMISFWSGDADPTLPGGGAPVTGAPGFATRDELIERYATATGRIVDDLTWYQVLAIWKLAILLEGSYARHLAGMTDDPFFAEMEHGVPALARTALTLAEAP